ncbi:MAG: SDR family oxidoreductase [Acetobacteraceae bacterium]|nr:SDR family oxidoreductase [Acetobacteraceae bacterium]
MSSLEGRTAFVSGGANGIGAGIAAGLRAAGAEVIVGDIAPAPEGQHGYVRIDVADPGSAAAAFDGIERLDILVNAAGIIRRSDEYELDVFQQVLAVNLTGAMRLCTAARPLLARQRGSVVNVASMLSFFGSGFAPAYSASKGAIAQLTKSLAIGWAADGIRVNAVAPGWIATNLTQALRDHAGRDAAILARTPLGRWGTPEDVAGAVVFLCSDAAAFITGVILPVDGGYLAR